MGLGQEKAQGDGGKVARCVLRWQVNGFLPMRSPALLLEIAPPSLVVGRLVQPISAVQAYQIGSLGERGVPRADERRRW